MSFQTVASMVLLPGVASAGAAQDLHAWRGLIRFVFGRGGMLRGRWRAVAAYHRPDFHPWRYLDNRRFLSELRDTIIDPAWEVRARRTAARQAGD